MIHFAATVLRRPLDPWQQWLVIHMGELLEDGRPRFRKCLVVVARQNGKTWLCTVLALYWLYVERWPLVFGTSNKIEYAIDAWQDAVDLALDPELPLAALTRKPRYSNGQNDLPTVDRCHYRLAAANDEGGRSKRIDRAIGDELRQQKTWEAYAAIVPTMNARPRAQIVWITNMGDDTSVVLNSVRDDAVSALGTDTQRPVFIAEWSAPAGSHPADPAALAAANPQAGRRIDWDTLLDDARDVARPGADPVKLTKFLTEILCMRVDSMEPAIDPAGWETGRNPQAMPAGARPALCIDCSPDLQHATVAVAAEDGDGWRVELVAEYDGIDALQKLGQNLAGLCATIRPRTVGWFPNGPAAALDAQLRDRRKSGRYGWPPRGIEVAELKAETAGVVMAFASLVGTGQVHHSGQGLLDAQVGASEKKWIEDKWVIVRRGAGYVDGVYAVAGAIHLARTTRAPRNVSKRLITG